MLKDVKEMKVRWIIENFTDSEDYNDLIQSVKDSGRDCFVIGRRNHFDFDPSSFKENDCVMFLGSIQMTRNVTSRLPAGCFPISYNTWDKYLCSSYYPSFKEHLFNDNFEFTTIGEFRANFFEFYRKFGNEAMVFIRPDTGEKSFQGQLLDIQDFDKFWGSTLIQSDDKNEKMLVSCPKNINGEWRFVCSKYNGGEIIAQSTYQYQRKRTLIPSAPVGATNKCLEILKVGYYPDSVFCVDICEDNDGNFWLLELTSFSSAGLYATDKQKVVNRVSEIVEMEYKNRG